MPVSLYLGCAAPPFHEQHYQLFPDLDDFIFVDKYIHHPLVKQWDAEALPVEDGSVSRIYSSHLLEHIEHTHLLAVLSHWYDKLEDGGTLTLNVPDLVWAADQIKRYDRGIPLEDYYTEWFGEHGLLSILYGSQSHPGEYHKSGFTERSLADLLKAFKNVQIRHEYDAHAMGVLIAIATK